VRVLYIGSESGTSLYRARALQRLGHDVRLFDLRKAVILNNRVLGAWAFRTGGLFLEKTSTLKLLDAVGDDKFDLVWVDGGELVGPTLVRELRARFGCVVNYNHDDPFGDRDGWRSRLYLAAVREYSLLVVVRDCNIAEARSLGARKVLRVFRSADEVAHAPRDLRASDLEKWSNQFVFVGTWMPERGPFMLDLIRRNVPIAIYGNSWNRAREWPAIKQSWRGPARDAPDEYALTIQCAKICLGLLSKGNRDFHTTRSMEIPYLGSLFLAERTPEHQFLYREDQEAVFWSNLAECAEKCLTLLGDDERCSAIAAAGRARCIANGHLNEKVIASILASI